MSGGEEKVLGRTLSVLMLVGSLLGSVNLLVEGVLRPGPARLVYAATMAALFVLGAVLALRPRVDERTALAWVLVADLVYVVIARTVVDAHLYATPLMLLFAAMVAAWFLGPRGMAVQVVALFVACWVSLAPNVADGRMLAVQVLVQGGVLTAAALAVQILRRRSQRLTRALHVASTTDSLTGLPNRRHLEDRMAGVWSDAGDSGLVAAIVLDVDNFKAINDGHGHAVGDDVLRAVARAVAAAVADHGPRGAVLARTGGEELAVLTAVGDRESALALGQRLREAVAGVVLPIPTTASVGVAVAPASDVPDPVEAAWRLLERADDGMYQAKRGGRDQAVLVTDG
ncbi:MAG TPA: GGDEF domain-containing protein [Actinomycetales bacterium]|nr:GGDEF domain-containing protein [Actinomycetales bacterium]